jgi:hypothetical protein
MQKGILKKDDNNNIDENNWNLFSKLDTKVLTIKKPKKLIEKMYNNARRSNMTKPKEQPQQKEEKDDEQIIADYRAKRHGKNKNKKK